MLDWHLLWRIVQDALIAVVSGAVAPFWKSILGPGPAQAAPGLLSRPGSQQDATRPGEAGETQVQSSAKLYAESILFFPQKETMFNSNHIVATKIATRFALRAKGLRRSQINDAIDLIDEDTLALASEHAALATKAPVEFPGDAPGALGDGSIFAAILDWFKSAQGQAVLSALIAILLKAIGI